MSFFDTFNLSLDTAQAEFGEPFTFNDAPYPAVNIEELDAKAKEGLGGKLAGATLTLEVSAAVLTASGVQRGSRLQARGTTVEVLDIKNDGSAALTLVCGPAAASARF